MHPDAAAIIRALGLTPHPEGGFYRETFRSPRSVEVGPEARSASTAIYFLLVSGGLSALHRVRSDEVWHHYDGDPIELHTIDRSGVHAMTILGSARLGERPQHVVPAETWQAAVSLGDRYSLCGCTVAPGFDFVDFEMPTRQALVERFPLLREVIARLTRAD
jgi:predicted cupin superfamily sugar epimerase